MRKIKTVLLAAALAALVCACGQDREPVPVTAAGMETLKAEASDTEASAAETAAAEASAEKYMAEKTPAEKTPAAEIAAEKSPAAGAAQAGSSGAETETAGTKQPPETAEARFTALVRGNDGFEAAYSTGRESLITCGGKDGIYWFSETFEDGTAEECIATLGENGWKCRHLHRAEAGGEPEECGDTEAIARIAACVYRGQENLSPGKTEPEELTVSGYDCRRYELPSGPLDILDEYEVTASYRDPEDGTNDLFLEYYIVGDEVEAAAF